MVATVVCVVTGETAPLLIPCPLPAVRPAAVPHRAGGRYYAACGAT
eukprot:COSAG01_NODE_71529_length_255_cov_1.333333_1_plen_45_part_01